jgi:4-hydroxy-4-methyl-2-oxoglutarate aldolase
MSLTHKRKIIDYIRRNRVSSTEVADCMNKSGAVAGVQAVNRGHFRVGNVFWAYAYGESNWHVHEQVQSVREGDVVFVETFKCADRAIFGDLVSKYLILYKQASAIVVTGTIRDAHRLVKENWPIWCRGFNPIGCFNENIEVKLEPGTLARHRARHHGAIAVCDDTGVVVVPKSLHNAGFVKKLEAIESQEDIWYECVDRRKWSTFDTVCLKRYLKPNSGRKSERRGK